MDIKEIAKEKIYKSNIIKYVTEQDIEDAFSRIHIIKTQEELIREHGDYLWKDGQLEGFNRADGSYIGPMGTPHTVIHEVLHALSSKFDKSGHRMVNGIQKKGLNFSAMVNEGLTDYLSSKISGEKRRHYLEGHLFFGKLEPVIQRYSKDPDILMKIYVNNDVEYLRNFLNTFGEKDTFEKLYNNYMFYNDEKFNKIVKPIEKNVNKFLKREKAKEKRQDVLNKIKFFLKINKAKMIEAPKEQESSQNTTSKREEFLSEYKYGPIVENKDIIKQKDIKRLRKIKKDER